jgi:DinB superfamily/Helix-turn-helix domain
MGRGDVRMSLRELRAYTGRTQVEAAAENRMTQSELSRLERREDFLLSTLRRYVDSLGGTLEVRVMLGSSEIRLTDGERAGAAGWEMKTVHQALDVLASIGDWLPAVVAGLPPEKLRERREGCGAFCLLEHVWHLRDIDEIGYLRRVRRTLKEERPELPDIDGDRLAAQRAYRQRALRPAQDALLRGRRKAVAQLRRLEEKDFRRKAVLEGAGPVTLGDLVLRWRAHDIGHRVEMERLAAALRA